MKKLLCALMIGAMAAGVAGMAFATTNAVGNIDIVVKKKPSGPSIRVGPTGTLNVFQVQITEPGLYEIQVVVPPGGASSAVPYPGATEPRTAPLGVAPAPAPAAAPSRR